MNRTAEILGEKWDLPLGFTMALGENPDAMFIFSSMPKKYRESCIDRARNANSRSEMQRIVSDIAQKLCLSVKTISTYKTRIMTKLNCKQNSDLVNYALKNNILDKY